MADPLSLTATIAGLIVLGAKASITLSQFIDGTRSASSEILALSRELTELCILLGKLEGTLCHVTDPQPVLDSCMESFKSLVVLLNMHRAETGDGIWARGWRKLKWTMKEKEVGRLRRDLEAHKLTLNITLVLATHTQNTDIIESSRVIESTMFQIKELVSTQLQLVPEKECSDPSVESPPMANLVVDPSPEYSKDDQTLSVTSNSSAAIEGYLNRASLFLSSRPTSTVGLSSPPSTINTPPRQRKSFLVNVPKGQETPEALVTGRHIERPSGPRSMRPDRIKIDHERGPRYQSHPNLADARARVPVHSQYDEVIRKISLQERRVVSEQILSGKIGLRKRNTETLTSGAASKRCSSDGSVPPILSINKEPLKGKCPQLSGPPRVVKVRKRQVPEDIGNSIDVLGRNVGNGECSELESNIATCYQGSFEWTLPAVDYASDQATYCPSLSEFSETPTVLADIGKSVETSKPIPALEPTNPCKASTDKPAILEKYTPSQLTIPPSSRLCASCNLLVTLDDLIWGSTFLHQSCLLCDTCHIPLSLTTGFFRKKPIGTGKLGAYCVDDFLKSVLPKCCKCKVRGVRNNPKWLEGKRGREWKGRQFVVMGGKESCGNVVILKVHGGKYFCDGCWKRD